MNTSELSAVTPRALDALAFAERTARWEDDVSAAELRLFCGLYADALRKARQELGQSEAIDLQRDSTRDALLQLRHEACDMVRRVAQLRRAAQDASSPRWLRYAALTLMLGVLVLLASRDALAEQLDLGNVSHGKTWLASSRYEDVALSGKLGDFSAPFFFHTAYEANPWIEVDLGEATPVRSVSVRNRPDCCDTRALPLVIETSLDHEHWQVAATRKQNFRKWRASLATDSARWIRLRTTRETQLHFKAIVVRK